MNKKGFTLIELVVVMAIIASLTALASFNFVQARVRARDVQRKSELKQIQNALELYKNDRIPQSYPTKAQYLANVLVSGGYLAAMPIDPREKSQAGSWKAYCYDYTDTAHYNLVACLENTGDVDKAAGPNVNCSCASTSGVTYQITQP